MWLSKTDFVHCIIIKKGKIMGKMKELFIQQMNEQIADMSDAEYQEWLALQDEDYKLYNNPESGYPKATQEQKESDHDAWWNSLTNEQKQQLYNDQEKVFELSLEEMNHDLGFGK